MEPTTTSAFSAFITSDLFMWILGIAVPILLTYGVWYIYRLNRETPETRGELPNQQNPSLLPEPDRVTESLTRNRVPEDDRPLDLITRGRLDPVESGEPEGEALGPIHKVEEIQKHEPQALSAALSNTRKSFFGRLKSMFAGKPVLAAGELEDLEEILYTSDLGPKTVQRLMEAVEARVKSSGGSGFEVVREAIKSEMLGILLMSEAGAPSPETTNGAGAVSGAAGANGATGEHGLGHLAVWKAQPAVLMVVGVNGAGKTTTIGKLARRFALSGKKVLVAAGDTFRAAAGDQLRIWTERAQVEIFFPENVTDPSAVAYSACQKAQAEHFDIVIVDTAGRLHTQKNLMEELKKMKRVVQKLIPEAPHEVLLVLDSNSGQNALIQAKEFHQALAVTGVVLTKLDGTAKGGVAIGLACELQLPIKLIGVGEGMDDLRQFSPQEFVDSII